MRALSYSPSRENLHVGVGAAYRLSVSLPNFPLEKYQTAVTGLGDTEAERAQAAHAGLPGAEAAQLWTRLAGALHLDCHYRRVFRAFLGERRTLSLGQQRAQRLKATRRSRNYVDVAAKAAPHFPCTFCKKCSTSPLNCAGSCRNEK